jgi:hypothetical protein
MSVPGSHSCRSSPLFLIFIDVQLALDRTHVENLLAS